MCDILIADSDSTMRRFESARPSQPVRRAEKMSLSLGERPANGGLLRITHESLGSDFGHSRSEIADSLGQTFEKLPFLGDCGWRPGPICTAWPSLQYNSPQILRQLPPANWECRARTAAPARSGMLPNSPSWAADRSGMRSRLSGLPVEIACRSRRCWSPEWTWSVLQRRLSYGP
jgi:hypothetical protein